MSISSYIPKEGGAFISRSHGFKFESIMTSNPNNSKLVGELGIVVMKFSIANVIMSLIYFQIKSKLTEIV